MIKVYLIPVMPKSSDEGSWLIAHFGLLESDVLI